MSPENSPIRGRIADYFSLDRSEFLEDRQDVLFQVGDLVEILLYGSIFVPDLLEVEGSVILKNNIHDAERKFSEGRKKLDWPLEKRETSFNLVEVVYIFASDTTYSEGAEIKLTNLIAEAWRGRLKLLYPSRTFQVNVLTPEEVRSIWGLEFYEVR